MSLVEKLYKSRVFGYIKPGQYGVTGYESEVADLVRQIEARAEREGLTVSRWLTNSTAGWASTITWAVHKGPRPTGTYQLPVDAYVVILDNTEGKTKRCEAYRELLKLLNSF